MRDRKVLIGVCGGIAAYKIAYLTRLLVKAGAQVRVVMTKEAKAFITPLTLATLSRHPVYSRLYDPQDGSWTNHVELGEWADLMLIAPATANTLAKMAQGLADGLLLTTYLSARCPVWVAPAMDLDMWKHPATQGNLNRLRDYNVHILPPGKGELASGLIGPGRMAEPEQIAAAIADHFGEGNPVPRPLAGKKAIVTAGPTQENIDPVRFIGNPSSGKMGIAIAEALSRQGADVTLVKGPTSLSSREPGVDVVSVRSAGDMYEACAERFDETDIFVAAAAVADYTPAHPSDKKIKKKALNGRPLTIELVRTRDILGEMGKRKREGQLLVGFALETNDELDNAMAKLEKKNLDLIVLNSLRDAGAGFKGDTNKVTLIEGRDKIQELPLKSKVEVAEDIVHRIIEKLS